MDVERTFPLVGVSGVLSLFNEKMEPVKNIKHFCFLSECFEMFFLKGQ